MAFITTKPPGVNSMLADWPLDPAKIHCIGAASGLGGPHPGCEQGPAVLWQGGLPALLRKHGWQVAASLLAPQPAAGSAALAPLLRRLAGSVADALAAQELPLILGGDHAIAAGTWRGVGRALGRAPGLLWIDAHLDAHIPETSPSGNLHGMPLAALFGIGSPVLVDIPGPPLDPARVVVLGARSYESAEQETMQRLGVRVVTADVIAARGLAAVVAEAIALVADGGAWGISLDVDALDPSFAGAVSTPVPGGLDMAALKRVLHGILRRPGCCAFELAEFNPALDRKGHTAAALLELVDALAAPAGDGEAPA